MLGSFSISELIGIVVLCLPAAVADGALAVLRYYRGERMGCVIMSGVFVGFSPDSGSNRLAIIRTCDEEGRSFEQSCRFIEAGHSLQKGAPVAFLVYNGLCYAYQSVDQQGVMQSVTRRLVHFWPRLFLAPFAGAVYAAIFSIFAAMSSSMGDGEFWRSAELLWILFACLGWGLPFISSIRLRRKLTALLPELTTSCSIIHFRGCRQENERTV